MRRVAQKCKGNNAAHVKRTTPYPGAGFGGAKASVRRFIASKERRLAEEKA
jgi:hypothetical protein